VVVAEESRRSREAKSLADVNAVQEAVAGRVEKDEAGGARGTVDARTVAGRIFRRSGGEWTDAAFRDGTKLLVVEPFTEAWFALLRELPELEPYWKAMDHVTVMGRKVAIRLAPDGAKRLSATELQSAVASFRAK
jgi:hypothetical protein